MTSITPEKLKEVRATWNMSQEEFAALLGAKLGTYRGWEIGRFGIPGAVQKHIQTIENLKLIYKSWDKLATRLAKTEEYDKAVDAHEKLWSRLFPEFDRS